jgi:hypothetical protein
MQVINWDIISHPMNWVILFLMVLVAMIALHLILKYQGAAKPVSQ